MKKTIAAVFLTAIATAATASDSVCDVTTHGAPLKTKISTLDWGGNSDKVFQALGPGTLHTKNNDTSIVVWYDIKHIKRSAPGNEARLDCGVMVALSTTGASQKLTIQSLLANDIDTLLSGKVPNF